MNKDYVAPDWIRWAGWDFMAALWSNKSETFHEILTHIHESWNDWDVYCQQVVLSDLKRIAIQFQDSGPWTGLSDEEKKANRDALASLIQGLK